MSSPEDIIQDNRKEVNEMTQTAHHLKAGKYELIVFYDGKLVDPDNTFDLNCMYIEGGGRKILVDNGCGTRFQTTAGQLVKNMEAEGIKTGDITDIIFTHGHIDHVCGTVDKNSKPVFPDACYIITKKEWDFLWEPAGSNEADNFLFAPARRDFPPLKDRFNLVDDDYQVFPGLKLIPAPGHTPGNSMVDIRSGGERLLCIGDIIHLTRELAEPGYCAAFDVAPGEALKTRQEILFQTAREGTLVFACHFNFPGLGYIREKKGVLNWEAI
jgi:glyoxylase-like metal-dependent hydrolase (beta-lactamase superfamily II)